MYLSQKMGLKKEVNGVKIGENSKLIYPYKEKTNMMKYIYIH